jgi:hypothetical protein
MNGNSIASRNPLGRLAATSLLLIGLGLSAGAFAQGSGGAGSSGSTGGPSAPDARQNSAQIDAGQIAAVSAQSTADPSGIGARNPIDNESSRTNTTRVASAPAPAGTIAALHPVSPLEQGAMAEISQVAKIQ